MPKARLGYFLARNPFPHGFTDGLFYREKMRAIHRIAPIAPAPPGRPERVLDVGGGRSGLAAMLYPGAEVVTLDRDGRLHGQAPIPTAFVCGDAATLPFDDESFDVVTLFDVLEHVADDAGAAAEAMRVVRRGGWVLLSTPDASWRYPFHRFMRPLCPPESTLTQEWGHVRRGYGRERLEALFGAPAASSASFINPLTAFYHDVAFSNLHRRQRQVLYALTSPLAAAGYLLHRPSRRGAEAAFAWRR